MKTRVHWTGPVGGFGIAVGLILLFIALEVHDGDRLIAAGIMVIGGALLRIEAAIRTYRIG